MQQKTLCEIFGLLQPKISDALHSALLALRAALRNMPDARIEWPDDAGKRASAARIEAVYGVKGIFAFVDGLNLQVQVYTHHF